MKRFIRSNTRALRIALFFIADSISVVIASYLALLIKCDFRIYLINDEYIDAISEYAAFNIVITIGIFLGFKLYKSIWRFAGVAEFANVVFACLVSSCVQLAGMILLKYDVPYGYYVIYWLIFSCEVLLTRFAYKIYMYIKNNTNSDADAPKINVMIIGAGEAANMTIKEIMVNNLNYNVVGLIDDDDSKTGNYLQGYMVLGNRHTIIENVKKYDVNEIFVAMPSANKQQIKEILDICKETTCSLRILPGVYQLLNGKVSVSSFRKVEIEDLLGREPVTIDMKSVADQISGKVVLVTGGGGSIGSELCRQIASYSPAKLIIVEIYENNAYEIQQDLIRKYPELSMEVLIASVRNTHRIETIMEEYRPDIVYHAAAHKHVPLMEDSPNEAVKNNVFGTYKTARAAAMYGVKKFVLISTDKAVNPTNIMGASKRLCEMIVQSFNEKYDTDFVAVRFGNVLGSNGSVIPLFTKQIEMGGPVTVTHPDIIRYFMTISEAVSLVLQAGVYATGGEIFVLDMGEPVKILDLAVNLIRLSGYEPNVDIQIEFTGLRPGEKLYEEMLMKEEGLRETANRLIHIGRPIEFDKEHFFDELEKLKMAAEKDSADIRDYVKRIVKTYKTKE
ncbi:MAG: polysaccharide biosynthesis protein [Lachnospira sp.]|nr:polysaccharide biosynthesis protein [Lachnospira sp.]